MDNKKYQISLVVFFVMIFSLLLFYQNCSKSTGGNLGGVSSNCVGNNCGGGNNPPPPIGIIVSTDANGVNIPPTSTVTIGGQNYTAYTFTKATDNFHLQFTNTPPSALACMGPSTQTPLCYPYPFTSTSPDPNSGSILSNNNEYSYNSSNSSFSFIGWGGGGDYALKDGAYMVVGTYQLCVYDPNNYLNNYSCVAIIVQ